MALTPLYPILTETIAITVATGGALAGATEIPVEALDAGIPAGTILDFTASGDGKFAKLATEAAAGDDLLDVEPLGVALIAGDEADYAPPSGAPLLGEKWAKLGGQNITNDERAALQLAYQLDAELALDLRAPVYTGDDALELSFAVVHQIAFMIEHGITASNVKSISQGSPGASKVFRDRWVDPTAAAIVRRVTGAEPVRFDAPWAGV